MDPLDNPFWHALTTEQEHLAIGSGPARRFPADVIPFAGVAELSVEGLRCLAAWMQPGEAIYVAAEDLPGVTGLEPLGELPCWQMGFSGEVGQAPASGGLRIEALTMKDAPAMVALTDIAFPGFFRPRTPVLGAYFGIRDGESLIAMAGERLALPGLREVSGVCTHPGYTRNGLAALLIRHVVQMQAAAGLGSFLHVSANNHRALQLYERLGFQRTRRLMFHRLRRR